MRNITGLAVLAVVGGCASGAGADIQRGTPTTTRVETGAGNYDLRMTPEIRTSSHWIRASRDTVWAVLPEVYEGLGISVRTVDAAAGSFGNRDVRVTRIAGERLSRFLDCGKNPIGAPVANTGNVQMDILTRVSDQAAGTQISTTLQARAGSRSGSASQVQCTSTGALELLIATGLAELTGSGIAADSE